VTWVTRDSWPVPPENLKTVQRIYQEWAAGNARIDTSVYDPHFVYISQLAEPEPGPHFGLEAANEYYRRFLASWQDWRIEASEFREVGDSVIVRARRSGVGRGSRAAVGDEAFHVWTLRGGKIIRLDVFEREHEALEAVGLRE
jgi:ketosteroid isomerase-like protein